VARRPLSCARALIDLSRKGAAILVISEDLEELLEISDRIAVLYQGRLSTATPRHATDIEQLGFADGGELGRTQARG